MRYLVRPAARRDIKRYWAMIAADNERADNELVNVAESTMEKIAAAPLMLGHEMGFRRHAGVRSYRLPDPYTKYLLFFRVHARHVEFKRLVHGARHLPRLFRTRQD